MLGIRSMRAGSGGNECSPLATQLQQAWLQSQISTQSPKFQKRVQSDVSAERRAANPQLHPEFHQIASDLSSIVADHAASLDNAVNHEDLYFHKSRHETPEFPKRPVFPQLVSYSQKADLPQRSRSGVFPEMATSAVSGVSSPRSGTLSPACSSSSSVIQAQACEDAAVDSESKSAVDHGAQPAELFFLNGDENVDEGEMFLLPEDFDYQAMAEEIDDLMGPRSVEISGDEPGYDNSWTATGFIPTEEGVTDKLIHAYTCNLTKHVTDASESVDASTWEGERDACTDHGDDSWDWYVDFIQAKSGDRRSAHNTSSPSARHQNSPFDDDMSQPESFSFFTPGCVDLQALLMRCALVVSRDDVRSASDLIRELRQHSSAYGNSLQRMAYYYMEALVAKMSGTGAQLYTAISSNTPSTATMLKAQRLFVDYSPYIKVSHFFSTKSILDAFEGAQRVHVVDYGTSNGVQWPCLIQSLSQRREGPPHLRITCIDLPQPGNKPSKRVLEVGRRLADFAKLWGVPFDFDALADKWESITAEKLCLKEDEVLAVNCQYTFRNLLDESIMAASPRKVVLDRIRSMNPKVFVMLTVNANHNAPFFMTRFRESMKYYSTMFEAMEVSMPANDPDRVILEREFYGREILNIVACDGLERVERAEPYRQWQSRTQRAGFSPKPLLPIMISKIQSMMGSYHRDYGVGEDGDWFLMGWKNHIVRAMTVWEPTPTPATASATP